MIDSFVAVRVILGPRCFFLIHESIMRAFVWFERSGGLQGLDRAQAVTISEDFFARNLVHMKNL